MTSINRRDVLKGAGATGVSGLFSGCLGSIGGGDDTIKMGILEDKSGTFALFGQQKLQAQKLAIEEINENGGIGGREIEVHDPDPQSDPQRYQELARELIQGRNVDVLFAGFASSTREAVRPIVDDTEQLYFYTNQYEGGVCDTFTWCTGAVPEQQISPVLPALVDEYGPNLYTIASDYNFGQITAAWYRRIAKDEGYNIVGEEFIPLEVSQFGAEINRIQEADPDILIVLLTGSNNTQFYGQKNSANLDIPMTSTINMAQGYEHLRFDPPAMKDMHVGVNYMEEIPTDRNQKVVDNYYERWPDARYLGQMAQNSYFTTYLYKKAVEQAGTKDQVEVANYMDSEQIEIEAPEGNIRTDPQTHHMTHVIRVARADENHNIEFIDKFESIEPYWLRETPYPGCNLTKVIGPSKEEEPTEQYVPQGV